MTKATIGTISHGTLRNEDLLSAFANELERLGKEQTVSMAALETPEPQFQSWLDEQKIRDDLIENARTIDPDSENASEIVHELMDWLNAYAPEYCYFGTLEGDSSDFGFWPAIDQIEEDVRDGALTQISDPADMENHLGDIAVFVSDHGNVTLYNADGSVAWDCV